MAKVNKSKCTGANFNLTFEPLLIKRPRALKALIKQLSRIPPIDLSRKHFNR